MTVQRMGDSALRPGLDLGPQRLGQAVDPEQIRLEMTLGGQRPEQVCDGDRMVRAVFHTDLVTHPELSLLEHPEIWSRSEEHTSELQSLMRNSYAVFCLKKKN